MSTLHLTHRFAPSEIVPVLLEFLDHPKVFQRHDAFYAPLRVGEPAIEPLIAGVPLALSVRMRVGGG